MKDPSSQQDCWKTVNFSEVGTKSVPSHKKKEVVSPAQQNTRAASTSPDSLGISVKLIHADTGKFLNTQLFKYVEK